MFSYLAEKTALLPLVELGSMPNKVGKSTVEAMRMGARWGYQGMVREILERIQKSLKSERVTICATGGYAKWVFHGFKPSIKVDPDLTLFGLGRIYELNRKV